MNRELTVSDMEMIYNELGLVDITTENQRKKGMRVYFDKVASNNGPRVEYRFSAKSGLVYRDVKNGNNPYPVNKRDYWTLEYARETKRSRAMNKALHYVETYRNRRSES